MRSVQFSSAPAVLYTVRPDDGDAPSPAFGQAGAATPAGRRPPRSAPRSTGTDHGRGSPGRPQATGNPRAQRVQRCRRTQPQAGEGAVQRPGGGRQPPRPGAEGDPTAAGLLPAARGRRPGPAGAQRPPHLLPLQGHRHLLVAHRRRQDRRERGLELRGPDRGGPRHPRLHRLLLEQGGGLVRGQPGGRDLRRRLGHRERQPASRLAAARGLGGNLLGRAGRALCAPTRRGRLRYSSPHRHHPDPAPAARQQRFRLAARPERRG